MKKLRLCLDRLEVQSFHLTPATAGRGTVAAHLDDSDGGGDGGVSDAYTCTWDATQCDCGPDGQRRIIVYSDGASCTCPPS